LRKNAGSAVVIDNQSASEALCFVSGSPTCSGTRPGELSDCAPSLVGRPFGSLAMVPPLRGAGKAGPRYL
jgi:hypothetical protein